MTGNERGVAPRRRGPNRVGEERVRLRDILASDYRHGLSIRDLCAEHGLSYGLTHTLLAEARVQFRVTNQPSWRSR